ncbi:hypothetical protein [Georgenia faecalis]|uniref:hypothetical protein n=1 Tax=Georgenia faecalis TaxID=2483799 RepID=UPI000FD8F6F5|nr:hypothetical protein [Georgenia faecalis]
MTERMGGTARRRPRLGRGLVAAGASVLVMASAIGGCDRGNDGGDGADPVRDAFDARDRFAECDPVILEQGEEFQLPPAALDCLAAPIDGSAPNAELRVEYPTVEGDPIVHHFRTRAGRDTMEIVIDPSADEFGSVEGRHWRRCEVPFTRDDLDLGCP